MRAKYLRGDRSMSGIHGAGMSTKTRPKLGGGLVEFVSKREGETGARKHAVWEGRTVINEET